MSGSEACPACGAPVSPAEGARLVYCDYCDQALVVLPEGFDARGGAALAETITRTKVGESVRIRGDRFKVVGQVQYSFEEGTYDHFYLRGDQEGWLEQDEGEFRLYLHVEPVESAPAWDDMGIGVLVPVGEKQFYPMEFGEGAVVGGRGGLPLLLTPGLPFQYVDGTVNGEAASLKYTPGGVFLFTGLSLEAEDVIVEESPS